MAKKDMMWFGWVAFVLLVVGGINWGLIGLFNFSLLSFVPELLARIVYVLVGVAGVYGLVMFFKLMRWF